KIEIDDRLNQKLKKKHMKKIASILKELVNNSFRHSSSSYILISLEESSKGIVINYEQDGVGEEDYHRIKNPNGGLCLVSSLVKGSQGTWKFYWRDSVLTSHIVIGDGKHEDFTL
ncbi:MAG: hypothetical protein Q4Q07_10860, partial [Tissierellia bacterium]|nr:hypothetical protein [Tissierellia bacterium]